MELKEILFAVALSSASGLGTLGYTSLSDTTKDNKQDIEKLDDKLDQEKNSNTALHKDVEYNQALLIEIKQDLKEMKKNDK